MSSNTKMYWIYALTPLHVGAGRGVGFVDLPIVREKITRWPLVPGSALKGVWRDHFLQQGTEETLLEVAFGQKADSDHAGALVLTDARMVLLPVRSFYGTFAYATSPLALRRLRRDLEMAGCGSPPEVPEGLEAATAALAPQSRLAAEGKVYFEDLDFSTEETAPAAEWADFLAARIFAEDWRKMFKERFVILPDPSFDFLCQTGTEVNARVRIEDEKKRVARGALWYEESLPAETVLAGIVWCDRIFGDREVTPEKIVNTFAREPVRCQIGGKATVGKGQVQCRFSGAEVDQ